MASQRLLPPVYQMITNSMGTRTCGGSVTLTETYDHRSEESFKCQLSWKNWAQARAELEAHYEDPFLEKVAAAVRDKDAISTAALLDLLHVQATTGTARRLAAVMRTLNFIPIKSRRLMPGGRTGNTVTRGWARPVRSMKSSPTMKHDDAVTPQGGLSHAI